MKKSFILSFLVLFSFLFLPNTSSAIFDIPRPADYAGMHYVIYETECGERFIIGVFMFPMCCIPTLWGCKKWCDQYICNIGDWGDWMNGQKNRWEQCWRDRCEDRWRDRCEDRCQDENNDENNGGICGICLANCFNEKCTEEKWNNYFENIWGDLWNTWNGWKLEWKQEWVEYKASATECEPDILRRECQSVCGPYKCPPCTCGRCKAECTPWEGKVCEECGSWQVAERECNCKVTKWGLNKPECICRGECIMVPEGLRFYNNPNYPTDPCEPEEGKDPYNLFLPIKNDWDDVQGWSGGWKEGNECPVDTCLPEEEQCPYCPALENQICHEYQECVQVYQIIIRGTEPTQEEKDKEMKKGEMRDCQALTEIDRLIKKGRNANDEGDLDRVEHYKEEIKRIKDEELIIAEYRVMIDYKEEKVIIEKVKKDGSVRSIVVKQDELDNLHEIQYGFPLVRLGKSEIIVPLPFCPCFFKSGRTYELKIRACCDAPENNLFYNHHHPENCGEWTEWQKFITNEAPELKSPHDPDWKGPEVQQHLLDIWAGRKPYLDFWNTEARENLLFWYPDTPNEEVPIPPFPLPLDVNLKWCETDFKCENRQRQFPLSYKLRFYEFHPPDEYIWHHYLLIVANKYIPYNLIFSPELRCPLRPWYYLPPEFPNEIFDYFYKDTIYAWRVAVCKDEHPLEHDPPNCTEFSQKWKFQMTEELEKTELFTPHNEKMFPPVGLPVRLGWKDQLGAASYRYQVFQNGSIIKEGVTTTKSIVLDLPPLSVNTVYSWRILPCWDLEGEKCRLGGDGWSEKWYFKTTGQIPFPGTLIPHGLDIPIPTLFTWRHVPGAKSYVFNIQGNGLDKTKIIETDEAKVIERGWAWIELVLNFPYLRPDTLYFWKVKTCARPGGEECGPWSDNPYDGVDRGFTTFTIPTPSNPQPEDNAQFFIPNPPRDFSWNFERIFLGLEEPFSVPISFSQFEIEYTRATDGETDECVALVGAKKTEIITGNHIFNPLALFEGLKCRGEYRWRVRGCLDRECTEAGTGEWSNWWNFTLTTEERLAIEIGAIGEGLVPCGRKFDNPDTRWDETDRCKPKHIFILLYSIISFALWTMIPLILVILVVYTGAMFYLAVSIGTKEVIPKVKALWRSVGIGFAIIFLSWILVTWFLLLFGYQLGPWYYIPL